MKRIIIFCYTPGVSGVKAIIDNIENQLYKLDVNVHVEDDICKIANLSKQFLVIPYGIKAAYDLAKIIKCDLPLALLIDAYTLGCKNLVINSLYRRKVFNTLFLRQLISYIIYSFKENYVLRRYKQIVLVNQYDADYMKNKYKKIVDFIILKNGVALPHLYPSIKSVNKDGKLTIGILSHWSDMAFNDAKSFIEDSYPFLQKNMSIELIVAGRGATQSMINYFDRNKVSFIGEVLNLSDFFDQIDVYLVSVVKKCGILNKVLDSFAYRKIVIGKIHNFYPFIDLEEGYITYSTNEELLARLTQIQNEELNVDYITKNAFNYVKKYHNWDTNYSGFASYLKKKIDSIQ
ncbi:MAG: hypothetical protein RL662_1539 [Bacteroidota bacterium]|jgi:hypothetical protein